MVRRFYVVTCNALPYLTGADDDDALDMFAADIDSKEQNGEKSTDKKHGEKKGN